MFAERSVGVRDRQVEGRWMYSKAFQVVGLVCSKLGARGARECGEDFGYREVLGLTPDLRLFWRVTGSLPGIIVPLVRGCRQLRGDVSSAESAGEDGKPPGAWADHGDDDSDASNPAMSYCVHSLCKYLHT